MKALRAAAFTRERAADERREARELDTLGPNAAGHRDRSVDGGLGLAGQADDEADATVDTVLTQDLRAEFEALGCRSFVDAVEHRLVARLEAEVDLMAAGRAHRRGDLVGDL